MMLRRFTPPRLVPRDRWTLALLLLPLAAGCGVEASRPPAGAEASGPAAEPAGEVRPAALDASASAGTGGAAAPGTEGSTDGGGAGRAEGEPTAVPALRPPPPPLEIPADPPRFRRPEHVRGIYLNAWTAGSPRRLERLVALARETELNTFVIDVKDASGYVSHPTGVALARGVGAAGEIRIPDLSGLLRQLEREGIYPIARIVIAQDPVLARARPDLAVQDREGGVWVDGKGIRWLNPHSREVWDYHVELAREAAALGFPEIQWDYVRFPDAPRSELARAVYPGAEGRGHTETIRAFLAYGRDRLAELGVAVTADVFGVTTSARDVGIGQIWESFIDVVDAALPMIYPSHYHAGSFGVARPNFHPYEIVKHALGHGVRRSRGVEGAGAIVPWLQDFSLGQPAYGAAEVRAQIQATYDAGIQEWILWNASSRYTEGALEPAGGFAEEPWIRVAGQLAPVSRRHELLRAAAAEAAAEAARDAAELPGPPADKVAPPPVPPPDTLQAPGRYRLYVPPGG